MDGNKEVTAWSFSLQKQGLYAAVVALGSLRRVAQPATTAFYSMLLNAVASKR